MPKKKDPFEEKAKEAGFPGYPHYPASQDVCNKEQVEEDLDPENPKRLKPDQLPGDGLNEKDFRSDVSGSDLDVPGSEDDDPQEAIGSEDEENNHYSLGGDDKEGLEEG